MTNTSGKFVPKSDSPRKIRSVNLTDETWQRLAAVAQKTGKTRNDFLESLLQGNNQFIETVTTPIPPFIEMVLLERDTDGVNMTQSTDRDIYPFI